MSEQFTVDEIIITLDRAIKEIEQLRLENIYLKNRLQIAEKYMPAEWMDEDDLV